MDNSDSENDEGLGPRERWESDQPLPEVKVSTTHRKTGQPRSDEAIANDRRRLALRAQREERWRIGAALPRQEQGIGVLGGAHEVYTNWTADEDEALLRILPLNKMRPSWAEVTLALTQETHIQRTAKSVRCRWNRMRKGRISSMLPEGDRKRPRYRCRLCGNLKAGHLCPGTSSKPTTVNEMLIGVHNQLVANGLQAEDSSDEEEPSKA